MSSSTTKAAFWQGFRDGAPFLLVIVPFSVLFGVLATEAGAHDGRHGAVREAWLVRGAEGEFDVQAHEASEGGRA